MASLTLEIADNSISRSHGLMDRKKLDKNHGMLFIFPIKQKQSFWMQNTYMPLDIAFLDDDGKIFEIKNMTPLNTKMVTSSLPCRYALEVNEGWYDDNNLGVGSVIFHGKGGISDLKRKAVANTHGKYTRLAQATIEDEESELEEENGELEGELPDDPTINEFAQDLQEKPPEAEKSQTPAPDTKHKLDVMATIDYANKNNLEMEIQYWTLSGKILPPRRLQKMQNGGYEIKVGPNGRRVIALDVSPTIDAGSWKIKGMQIKGFLIDNIISLKYIPKQGVVAPSQEQTVKSPQNFWDRLKNIVKKVVR